MSLYGESIRGQKQGRENFRKYHTLMLLVTKKQKIRSYTCPHQSAPPKFKWTQFCHQGTAMLNNCTLTTYLLSHRNKATLKQGELQIIWRPFERSGVLRTLVSSRVTWSPRPAPNRVAAPHLMAPITADSL
jgi:hypothetical protein